MVLLHFVNSIGLTRYPLTVLLPVHTPWLPSLSIWCTLTDPSSCLLLGALSGACLFKSSSCLLCRYALTAFSFTGDPVYSHGSSSFINSSFINSSIQSTGLLLKPRIVSLSTTISAGASIDLRIDLSSVNEVFTHSLKRCFFFVRSMDWQPTLQSFLLICQQGIHSLTRPS